ncbi:hypothetical protein ABT160_43185 [Streptomyces sp. NPDC001941]|uniref:hypothetical protein n=1 Tax=Streptomyces sp. NPDC001941 TaxID=3154659 RepID=UPI003324B19C
MSKALTLSAIAVAASITLAGPATAFAADSAPNPNDGSSQSQQSDPSAKSDASAKSDKSSAAPVVTVTSSPKDPAGYQAGDKVTFKVSTSGQAKVTAASDALTGISVSGSGDSYTGTGTVKSGWGIGTAHLTVTANYGDTGAEGHASFSVNTGTKPSPEPGKASLSLSTDAGKAGDKVGITIKSGGLKGDAYVKSDAFGGRVDLSRGKDGAWHGTATVSGKVADHGYYAVNGFVGSQQVGQAKFTITENPAKPPMPGQSQLSVNPRSGKAGDKVGLVLTGSGNPKSDYYADSTAFGGKVHLTLGKDGKWHGTATVAHVKTGAYQVRVNSGAPSVSFDVYAKGTGPVKPLNPSDHKTPKGSVNTGMAPSNGSGDNALGMGAAAAGVGAAGLLGAGLLRRRRHNG